MFFQGSVWKDMFEIYVHVTTINEDRLWGDVTDAHFERNWSRKLNHNVKPRGKFENHEFICNKGL